MNEGYADLWAMSLADIAEIGKGFYVDNNDGIRRYDEEIPRSFLKTLSEKCTPMARSFVEHGTTPIC